MGDFHKISLPSPLVHPAGLIDTKCLVNPNVPALSHLRPVKTTEEQTYEYCINFTAAIKVRIAMC